MCLFRAGFQEFRAWCRLKRMQIRQQILEVLRVSVGLCGHQAAAVQDGCGYAFVIRWSATRQVRLFKDAKQWRAMQWVADAIVVALGTVGLKDLMPMCLLRVELVERRRRRRRVATGNAEDRR